MNLATISPIQADHIAAFEAIADTPGVGFLVQIGEFGEPQKAIRHENFDAEFGKNPNGVDVAVTRGSISVLRNGFELRDYYGQNVVFPENGELPIFRVIGGRASGPACWDLDLMSP